MPAADPNICPYAIQVRDLRPDPPRSRPVWGLCLHTSGRGILAKAKELGVDPVEAALGYYQSAAYSIHYLIDYDGTTYQITADDRKVPHIGVEAAERSSYLSGRWATDSRLAVAAVARWRARWPDFASPQHLYPGPSANDVYIGGELLPLATPTAQGRWFTDEQHFAAGKLAADIARRHIFPGGPIDPQWVNTSRLVGHEDLDAFGRWDRGGGWDPGALRSTPRLSWPVVNVVAIGIGLKTWGR